MSLQFQMVIITKGKGIKKVYKKIPTLYVILFHLLVKVYTLLVGRRERGNGKGLTCSNREEVKRLVGIYMLGYQIISLRFQILAISESWQIVKIIEVYISQS